MINSLLKQKGLHFMHFNIRSLLSKNKFDMFKQQMSMSNIDIICVQVKSPWLS